MIIGNLFAKKILCKALKSKCMVEKFFQEVFMFLMNGGRGCCPELFMCECFQRNGSKALCK